MTTLHASLEGWTAIVIVSAEGDRMQSSTPTALHVVAGVPMVRLVCDAIREAGVPFEAIFGREDFLGDGA